MMNLKSNQQSAEFVEVFFASAHLISAFVTLLKKPDLHGLLMEPMKIFFEWIPTTETVPMTIAHTDLMLSLCRQGVENAFFIKYPAVAKKIFTQLFNRLPHFFSAGNLSIKFCLDSFSQLKSIFPFLIKSKIFSMELFSEFLTKTVFLAPLFTIKTETSSLDLEKSTKELNRLTDIVHEAQKKKLMTEEATKLIFLYLDLEFQDTSLDSNTTIFLKLLDNLLPNPTYYSVVRSLAIVALCKSKIHQDYLLEIYKKIIIMINKLSNTADSYMLLTDCFAFAGRLSLDLVIIDKKLVPYEIFSVLLNRVFDMVSEMSELDDVQPDYQYEILMFVTTFIKALCKHDVYDESKWMELYSIIQKMRPLLANMNKIPTLELPSLKIITLILRYYNMPLVNPTHQRQRALCIAFCIEDVLASDSFKESHSKVLKQLLLYIDNTTAVFTGCKDILEGILKKLL